MAEVSNRRFNQPNTAPRNPRNLCVSGLICCVVVAVATLAGCQNLSQQADPSLPIPDTLLDTSKLDNVRFQSPGGSGSRTGGGSGSRTGAAGGPSLLNDESHRVRLDAPVLQVDDHVDQSQLIAAVNFRGNSSLAAHQLQRNISTRPGRYYDPDRLQQDVKTLWKMAEIEKVNGPFIEQGAQGITVTFDIEERKTVTEVKFIGNRGVKDRTLLNESGLDNIGHLDVHRIRIAKTRIEEFYRQKGYPRTQVEIREGSEADDSQIVFLVHEDQQQRFWDVEFEGNALASDARLKSQIQGKPGILKLFGGLAEREKVDQDIVRLESYYKSLGYFNVQIGRELKESNDGRWVTVRFVINEGPRYKIREVRFVGNERYSSEDLIKLVSLKPELQSQQVGLPDFNAAKMREDVTALRDLYGANGFVYSDVKAEPRFLEEPGYLDMVYKISEGERYRVGKINVHFTGGNGITRREVVLNRMSQRPGDWIDMRKIENDKRRLASARIFASGQEDGGRPPSIVVKPPSKGSEFARVAKQQFGIPDAPSTSNSSSSSGSGTSNSSPSSGSGSSGSGSRY